MNNDANEILSFIISSFKPLVPWIVAIMALIILNYLTTMFATCNSRKSYIRMGLHRLMKKVGYLSIILVVTIAANWALVQFGINLKTNNVLIDIVFFMFLINEISSILENIFFLAHEIFKKTDCHTVEPAAPPEPRPEYKRKPRK